jgi:hypothetical protein
MYHKFFILFIISPLIQSLPVNEALYNILKEKGQYELIDYNELFTNKDKNDIQLKNQSALNQSLEKKFSIIDIINVAESLVSLALDVVTLGSLVFQDADWWDDIPKVYDYRKKYKTFSLLTGQRKCESASPYAAALATSYRRAKSLKKASQLSGITIMEYFGRCKEINIFDSFAFINFFGLLEYPCRDQTYCEYCEYDDCAVYDEKSDDFYTYKDTTYKSNKIYGIKGEKKIKKEILANGPVVTSFKFYEDFLYYKNGYYEFVKGEYIGYHEAVIVGWDENGWIAQNSFGSFWGDDGFFKVKYDNKIGFGDVVFASAGFVNFKMVLFSLLIFIIF